MIWKKGEKLDQFSILYDPALRTLSRGLLYQLFEQAVNVKNAPDFSDVIIFEPNLIHPSHCDCFVGWIDPHEFTLLSRIRSPPIHYFISIAQYRINGSIKLRKCGVDFRDKLFVLVCSVNFTGSRTMPDKVISDIPINSVWIAVEEAICDKVADGLFICVC